jgi:hypothetical protein
MTSALAAGSRRISLPSKLRRRKTLGRGRRARSGDGQREAGAEGRIRTARTRPVQEIAASSTTSADGQGSRPPGSTAATACSSGLVIVVVVMVVVAVGVRGGAPAGPEHSGADPDHGRPETSLPRIVGPGR